MPTESLSRTENPGRGPGAEEEGRGREESWGWWGAMGARGLRRKLVQE